MTAVELGPTWVVGTIDLTYEPYMVDRDNAVDIGEPEMMVESIASQLADGDLERTVRYGNRTYVIPIYVTGPTLADVADAEAVLRAGLRRDGLTLTHDPGDSWAVPSVYEVQTARMTPARDDTHESHLIRKFTLTLTCAPFARSVNSVVVPALAAPPVTPTTVTVNGADTTAGWSAQAITLDEFGFVDSTPAVVDLGLDGISTSANCLSLNLFLNVVPQVALTGTPYLLIDMSGSTPTGFAVYYNDYTSSATPSPLMARALPGGRVQYALPIDPARSLSGLTIGRADYYSGPPSPKTFNVFDISRTDTLPNVTKRQTSRIIAGKGTERTPGSIHVSSPTPGTDLGHTIVHTCPEDGSGYSPPLRRWRYSGNGTPTAETARFSGAYEPTEPNAFIAQVPNSALPAGDYLLVARLYSTAAATVNVSWAAGTIVNSQAQGQDVGAQTVTFTAAGWRTFPLAILSLPTVRSLGPVTQIDIQTSTGDAVVTQVDEGWLFRMGDDCGLTIVDNPTEHLWLDSPDTTTGVPRTWIGDIADRSDARHPAAGLQSFGTHVISADGTALFTAAEVDNPAASAQFYPRWHSNAAE